MKSGIGKLICGRKKGKEWGQMSKLAGDNGKVDRECCRTHCSGNGE
jgi:hypothetical protein